MSCVVVDVVVLVVVGFVEVVASVVVGSGVAQPSPTQSSSHAVFRSMFSSSGSEVRRWPQSTVHTQSSLGIKVIGVVVGGATLVVSTTGTTQLSNAHTIAPFSSWQVACPSNPSSHLHAPSTHVELGGHAPPH